MNQTAGALVLVATPIGNLADLSERAISTLRQADVVACEDTRHSGRLLAHAQIRAKRLVSLHEHNEASRAPELVALIESGALVALVSDAGTPLVSDPGARLVAAVLEAELPVSVVPGPSAAVAAVVLSGFDTGRWCFEGFLPRKGVQRSERLEALASSTVPVVCYEAPKRLATTLRELAERCGGERRVAICRELTKLHEEVWRGSLDDAATRSTQVEPRGEHVLVLDGAVASEPSPTSELEALVGRLLDAGLKVRDAAAAAAVVLSVRHKTAYDAALAARPVATTKVP